MAIIVTVWPLLLDTPDATGGPAATLVVVLVEAGFGDTLCAAGGPDSVLAQPTAANPTVAATLTVSSRDFVCEIIPCPTASGSCCSCRCGLAARGRHR